MPVSRLKALTIHFIGIKTDFFSVTATLSGRRYYDFHFPVGETEAWGNLKVMRRWTQSAGGGGQA